MDRKKIPWWLPDVTGEAELRWVKKALDDNYINDGNITRQFEEKVASLVGTKYAVAVTSCTAALFMSLKALNIGHGDEVIVPDMTFLATANVVQMAGATLKLVDVDPNTLTISVKAIRATITAKTKAIIPVHVTGRAADMDTIMEIATEQGIPIIEDAAEAFMSKYKGKFMGTIGDIGCYSFSPNKIITTGQGGIVVTDDDHLYTKLRSLKDQGRPVTGTGGNDRIEMSGYNFKMTNLQAGVGLGQLEHLDKRIKKMRRIYEVYYQELKDVSGIQFYPCDLVGGAIPMWTDIRTNRRDELVDYLKNKNINSREYWLPMHTQTPYKMSDEMFPNSTMLSPMSLWLPSAFCLTDDDVRYVSGVVKEFFNNIA